MLGVLRQGAQIHRAPGAGISCSARQGLVLSVRDVLLSLGIPGQRIEEAEGDCSDFGDFGPVLLRQAKVNDVNLIGFLSQANQEVVGLDVPMDEVLGMHVLHPERDAKHTEIYSRLQETLHRKPPAKLPRPVDHLVGQHEGSLETELSVAEAKQIFERRSQQVNDLTAAKAAQVVGD